MNGRSMKDWLRNVFVDQNLNDLEHIDQTVMNGVRRWFRSQTLIPTLDTGHYDTASGKYTLGPPSPSVIDAKNIVTETTVSTASLATVTVTVPAGHAWKMILASNRNSDRAHESTLTYTPNGGVASVFQSQALVLVDSTDSLLGGSKIGTTITGSTMNGPLWMQAGDTLTITDDTFVAVDDVRKDFIYEDYVI